ncbi:MAG: HAMP domain-containing protein [Armatimonadetes bacterium]|nr:HAMP domain-containing protein [Armatimonadota bacterium]
MNLRMKTLLMIGVTQVCLIAILYLTLHYILMGRFAQLEERDARQNVGRARDALNADLATLKQKFTDWAMWDDTYRFVVDHNKEYMNSNLTETGIQALNVNLFLLWRAGRIVYGTGFDSVAEKVGPVPEGIAKHLTPNSPLLRHQNEASGMTGLLMLEAGPMLVTSLPIVTSMGKGPIHGVLIAGRFLDAAALKRLEETTHLSLKLHRLDGPALSPEIRVVSKSLSPKTPEAVQPVDQKTIAGFTLIDDIYGEPALALEIDLPRDIFRQGQSSMGYLLWSLVGLGLAFGAVIRFLMNKLVLSRLVGLTDIADRVAQGDVGVQVSGMESRDEIGSLARAFGHTVEYFQAMAGAADRLAGGDLTIRVTPRSEADVLGLAFARMVSSRRLMVHRINEVVEKLRAAAALLSASAGTTGGATYQITTAIRQVSEGTTRQSESVSRTASTIEEISQTIESVAKGAQEQAMAVSRSAQMTVRMARLIGEVSGNAQSGTGGADEAIRVARSGAQTVEDTLAGIGVIRAQVDALARRVREMESRSGQIGAITETIDNIARQTNLLALNAAIEAARAGEHGRGFAVVAAEVRKLAEKSASATGDITALLEGIREAASEAVSAMQKGAEAVEAGTSRAQASGEALTHILRATEAVHRQVADIAASTEEMSLASNEMMAAMESVSAVVEENTAATEEMAASSGEVTRTVGEIAGISQESSAAMQEIAATADDINHQVGEIAKSTRSVEQMAEELQILLSAFPIEPFENEMEDRLAA